MPADDGHKFLFFIDDATAESEVLELGAEEHHHLSRVVRLREGDIVYATNGRGLMLRCRVAEVGRSCSSVAVLGVERGTEPKRAVALALACLRKEHFVRAVEECTQLGMTRCIPFLSRKTQAVRFTPAFLDRLRRVALSAMKQSFRSTLPAIEQAIGFDALLERLGEFDSVVVGDGAAAPLRPGGPEGPLMIVVGPEGGLTDGEKRALEALHCRFGSVSAYRLRSETAAAAMMAVLLSPGE